MSSLKHLKEDTEYSKDNIKNEFVRGVYGSFPNIKKEHFKSKLFPWYYSLLLFYAYLEKTNYKKERGERIHRLNNHKDEFDSSFF